jgi:hypothetical protein
MMYTVGRGSSMTDKMVPRTVINDDDTTPGTLKERQTAVDTALRQLTELIETLENGRSL